MDVDRWLSVQTPRVLRWGVLVMGVVALLTVTALIIGLANARSDAKQSHDEVNGLIAQNQTLIAQIKAENAELSADHAQSQENQRIEADNLALELAYTAAQAERSEAVLRYLRTIGVRLPDALLAPIPAPRLSPIGGTSAGKASGHPSPTPGKGSGREKHHKPGHRP